MPCCGPVAHTEASAAIKVGPGSVSKPRPRQREGGSQRRRERARAVAQPGKSNARVTLLHFSNPFDDGAGALEAKAATLLGCLLLANVAAWTMAASAFASNSILLGTALLAYVLGLRHAFDPDHIAAIDNVVRKLVQDGRRPLATGFFFALGHSTVVVIAALAIATTVPRGFAQFVAVSGPIGTVLSASFLVVIGVANLLVLQSLWRSVGGAPQSGAASFDKTLDERGFLARLSGPLLRLVSRSWHLYPIGFLFGLGFDTATEIAFLAVSASEAVRSLTLAQIMMFPVLFTAGMVLVDTLDSVVMTGTYGFAYVHPERKLRYNLVVTAVSVAMAVSIGCIEAASLVGNPPDMIGPIWNGIRFVGDELASLCAVAIAFLAMASLVSFAIFRRGRYENLPRSPG
jgi:high-affinity nickel-transport protein